MKKTPELVQEAQRLREQGWSYRKIGKELGFSHRTIVLWLNPEVVEKDQERNRNWKKANPEKVREHDRNWRKANPEKVRESSMNYYVTNSEKVLQRSRKWYKSNLEKSYELRRNWRKANPGRCAASTASRKRGCDKFTKFWSKETNLEIQNIYINCPEGMHVDHIKPLSGGGWHHPCNLQYLTASENLLKHNKFRQCDQDLLAERLYISEEELDVPSLLLSV